MTDPINTVANTTKLDRAWRAAMGPMPANVREALILSSREDSLADVWRRVDTACAKALGIPQYAENARDYLRGEGLSADEARIVVAWIWPQAA